MTRIPIDSERSQAGRDEEVNGSNIDDANGLAAYDEQLHCGCVSDSTAHFGDQSSIRVPPNELVACLNLNERIWRSAQPVPGVSAWPRRIGRFEIERVLGQGGFGIVYLAQDAALHRQVALKVPRLHSLVDKNLRERFYREARAAAGLDHPNIVPIYEAGEEGPVCYIASAYCEGPNLAEWIKDQKTPIQPRLAAALVARLADAAHYSHTHGVFHRDVKPSNVMLVPRPPDDWCLGNDELPFIPRLTDFGLAKLHDGSLGDTAASAMLGTPSYMAPEQAGGLAEKVGPRTDVYSLGAVLYELLAGRPPFLGSSVADVLDEVRNREPLPLRHLRREIPRDLEIICLKCLEKNPGGRYPNARELADDLARFLRGDPVRARRPGTVYTVMKWLRRRPAFGLAVAISLVAVMVLLLGGVYYNRRLANALHVAQQWQSESIDREQRLRLQMYAADLRIAWNAWEAGNTEEMLSRLAHYQPQSGESDLRGFEWHLLRASCAKFQTLRGHVAPILTADVSPDDKFIASGDSSGTVKIWNLATGNEVQTLSYSNKEVTSVCFAPDGRTLATGGQDRTIRLWNVSDWSENACLRGHEKTVASVCWSPDGQRLASGGRDNVLKIWDAQRYCEVKSMPEQPDVVRQVAWSPDGKLLASAIREHGLKFWDTRDWTPLPSLTSDDVRSVLALAFSPDGKRIASAGYGGRLRIHDTASQRLLADLEGKGNVWSLRFSPNGKLLISGQTHGDLGLWETRTGAGELVELRTVQNSAGSVRAINFAHGGQSIVTAMEQSKVLQVRSATELAGSRPNRYSLPYLDVASRTNSVALLDENGTLRLASFPAGEPSAPALTLPKLVRNAVFFPQGNRLAVMGDEPGVLVYDTTSLQLLHRLEANEKILEVTISADGEKIAGSGESGVVWLWDATTQKVIQQLEGHQRPTVRSAFTTDGKLLATASSNEQRILLWDTTTGQRIAEMQAAQDVMALTFSPDGKTLAVAGYDHLGILWDVASQRQVGVLRGHAGALRAITYSPDGQTLVTAGDDGTARLWHVATRQQLGVLTRYGRPLRWARFLSPSQLAIGTASSDSDARRGNDILDFDIDKLASSIQYLASLDDPEK